jgi:catechol 2,3-dioxygenase-like lactoylglutathione lyase family enzyme
MTKVRGLGEIVIWVHDMDKALHFYSDVLGLQKMSPPDFRGAVFLRAGEPAISCPQQIVLVPLPADAPAFPGDRKQRTLHHLGLEVATEDFEAERERLEGLGYEVRFGEHPFLPLKGMYLDDPDGNEVELIASRE